MAEQPQAPQVLLSNPVQPAQVEELDIQYKQDPRLESFLQREMFLYYYALGKDRTVAKVIDKYPEHGRTIYKWSLKWRWNDRVHYLDTYMNIVADNISDEVQGLSPKEANAKISKLVDRIDLNIKKRILKPISKEPPQKNIENEPPKKVLTGQVSVEDAMSPMGVVSPQENAFVKVQLAEMVKERADMNARHKELSKAVQAKYVSTLADPNYKPRFYEVKEAMKVESILNAGGEVHGVDRGGSTQIGVSVNNQNNQNQINVKQEKTNRLERFNKLPPEKRKAIQSMIHQVTRELDSI